MEHICRSKLTIDGCNYELVTFLRKIETKIPDLTEYYNGNGLFLLGDEAITINKLAAVLGISRRTIQRFKQNMLILGQSGHKMS